MFNCENLLYKTFNIDTKTYSSDIYSANKLIKQYSMEQIAMLLKKKLLILIPCGKCQHCLESKKNKYHNKINSQNNLSKFGYLLTLTFNNDNIDIWANKQDREAIINFAGSNGKLVSPSTTLSKYHIRNIIRNLKKKLLNYYKCDKEELDFHYFLCGEYGSNTQRAHYHILLFLNLPIPYLTKSTCSDFHYQSKLLKSKQYDLYDLEILDKKTNTASYVTKYLTKANGSMCSTNYNLFEEQQIRLAIDNNFPLEKLKLFKNENLLKYYLVLYYLGEYDFIYKNMYLFSNKIFFKEVSKQKEFIKMSRKLGITGEPFRDLNSNVLNSYYLNKYKVNWLYNWYMLTMSVIFNNPLVFFISNFVYTIRYFLFIMLIYNLLFTLLDRLRVANIDKNFYKTHKPKDFSRYKQYSLKDIF